ncbi:hypothetical protein ZIOFF_066669 [Zingiber officinale]|uniref:Peptidase M24 domain-containing protein n=1 Tax=Zingiber officinale TaxID=94328 RepID=A0A8J5EYK6_ZINOF|nr:hypothetical protein ZIOFF_066669 [Zingiber officinale]
MPARTSPIQLCRLSSFFVDRFACSSTPLLRRNGGIRTPIQNSLRLCTTQLIFYSIKDSLLLASLSFLQRSEDDMVNNKHKRLQPGKVSPRFDVPDHIMKPPYKTEMHFYYQPGTTSDDIDKEVHQMIIENGAYPSPLGYSGFPKSVCTSVNECICHGIPDSRPLEDGDIINIDVTVFLNSDHANKFRYGVVQHFFGHGIGRVFHANPAILHYRNREWGRMQLGQTFTREPMLTIGSTKPMIWDDK